QRLKQLDHYGKCIGLSFQIQDDILDIEGDTESLGKQQGADMARNKPTYPALLGLNEAKQRARDLHEEALVSLASLDERADPLRWLSQYIIDRRS
ncbi:MAG: polyprenyl synthetase family protein, partial [Gammaproteobacteria bacterium]|nr:polyprenyl synthetase family protein [Gammaproteobacteria bacterium]